MHYTLKQIHYAAEEILPALEHKVVLFHAPMGAGKTTLIKALVKELGSEDHVSSPTFGLVNEYLGEQGPIYHFDFYRIESEEEALQMGVEEYLYSGHWCFIEWPQRISSLLPEQFTRIDLSVLKDGSRVAEVFNFS